MIEYIFQDTGTPPSGVFYTHYMKELDPSAILAGAEHQLTEPGVERSVMVEMDSRMVQVCAYFSGCL